MVEYCAIEGFCGGGQSTRDSAVAFAWARVAAWMIVREDNARAAMAQGVGDDLTKGEFRACLIAFVARNVEAIRSLIDMRDPKALPPSIELGEATGEELPCRRQAIELQRMFGTLISHPA